eukprot:11914855-Alexandrium_andersonii.AAC.1
MAQPSGPEVPAFARGLLPTDVEMAQFVEAGGGDPEQAKRALVAHLEASVKRARVEMGKEPAGAAGARG